MSNQITVTEGLVELKTLEDRISKITDNTVFIISHTKGKAPNGFSSTEAYQEYAKQNLQSVKDLIARRNKIKSAIVTSNAATKVVIGGETYTVAEAIEKKNSIARENRLLRVLTNQFNSCNSTAERANNQAQTRLDSQIETTLGKDAKSNPEDIKAITDIFWSKNEVVVLDPLSLRETIKNLQESIDKFTSEVDVKLSISNSTTMIEV